MGRPGLAVAVLGLLLVPSLTLGQPAGPVAPELPWWGPEDFTSGANLRVPLVIRNPYGHALENPPVVADLDVGTLAIVAGWPSGETGSRTFLKSFALSLSSVRVVEYTNFQLPRRSASDAQPVVADPDLPGTERVTLPAIVRPGWLEAPQERPYDPVSAPLISVTWIAHGRLDPGAERSYVLYFDVEQNGPREAMDQDRVAQALGGLYWISRGTEVYGSGTQVHVVGTEPDTRVTVFEYDGLQPARVTGTTNPTTVAKGEAKRFVLGTTAVGFLVKADKPVLATGQAVGPREQQRDTGFLPSVDNTLVGRSFDALVAPDVKFYVYALDTLGASGTLGDEPFRTTGPVTEVMPGGRRFVLEVDRPVMVQGEPELDRFQFAGLNGAPVSTVVVGTAYGSHWDTGPPPHREFRRGSIYVHPLDGEAAVRAETVGSPPRKLVPASGASLPLPADAWTIVHQREDWGNIPLRVESVAGGSPVAVIGGPVNTAPLLPIGPSELASPVGGHLAQRFVSPDPVHVFAFYNNTLVEATWTNGSSRATVLNQAERWQLPATTLSPVRIEAERPIAVIPRGTIGYGAGRMPVVEVLPLELQFRGYLVSLRPAGDEDEPLVRSSSFGEEVRYALEATNLARTADGSGLTDTILIDHPPVPPGWNVTVEPRRIELEGGETANVSVIVRTPETRNLGDRLRLSVTASSEGNPLMRASVETVTLLRERRQVGLWYEVVDGPKQLLVRLNPGELREVPLIVGNLGSARDAVRLVVSGVQAGWEVELARDEEPVAVLGLGAGEQSRLDLKVRAPAAGGIILPTSFSVSAISLNDTSAADKVLFDGLVAAKSKLRLDATRDALSVRPGDRAVYELTLANEGNASADVQLNISGSLPEAWGAPDLLFRGSSLAAVENRLGSVPPTGPAPIPLVLEVPVAPGADGRLHLKLLVTATPSGGAGGRPVTLPLNLFVEPVVLLSVDPPPTTEVAPATGATLTFTLSNAGNVNATLPLVGKALPQGWSLSHPENLSVPAGANTTLPIHVGVPAGAPPTNTTLTLETVLPNGTAFALEAPIRVPRHHGWALENPGPVTLVPGVTTNLTLAARAVGNAPVTVTLTSDAPPGWRVEQAGQAPHLAPLFSGRAVLAITPPRGAPPGRIDLEVGPGGGGHPSEDPGRLTLTLTLAHPDLVVADLSLHRPEGPGLPAIVRGSLSNQGPAEVTNATVALFEDGRSMGRVLISKIGTGDTRVFALEVPEGAGGQLSVKADPNDRFVELDEANNEAPVPGTDPDRTAPWPGLLALPLIAVAAWILARRR